MSFLLGSHDDYPFFAAVVLTEGEFRDAGVRVWTDADRAKAATSYRERVEEYRESLRGQQRANQGGEEKDLDINETLAELAGAVAQAAKFVRDAANTPAGRANLVGATMVGIALVNRLRRNR